MIQGIHNIHTDVCKIAVHDMRPSMFATESTNLESNHHKQKTNKHINI